jgi:predicted transcriptional regulator
LEPEGNEESFTGHIDFDRISRTLRRHPTKKELTVLKFLLNGPKNLHRMDKDANIAISTAYSITNKLLKAGLLRVYNARKFEKTNKTIREYGLTYFGLFVLLRNIDLSEWPQILEDITKNYSKFYEDLPINIILDKWKLFKQHGLQDIYLAALYKMLANFFLPLTPKEDAYKIEKLLEKRLEDYRTCYSQGKRIVFVGKYPLTPLLPLLIEQGYMNVEQWYLHALRYFVGECIEIIRYCFPNHAINNEVEKLFSVISLDEDFFKVLREYFRVERESLMKRLKEVEIFEKIAEKFLMSTRF